MRVRLLALVSAVALFSLGAVPAQASSEGHAYLALGDSVPFGFNPNPALWPNAHNFTGYPEIVAQRLDIKDVNATCPGEATGGFLSLTGTDNSCRPYRASFPLHTQYNVSQMDYVLRYLTGHRDTRLITLTLGANDYFHLVNVCAALNPNDPSAAAACVGAGIPAMLGTMFANLNTILGEIRSTGYTGLIVAVTYYSLTYPDTSGADLLNGPMIAAAHAHGVVIASGVEAWRDTAVRAGGGSTCAAGLRLPPFPPDPGVLGCDVHPTPLGRDLLAGAVINAVAASCPAHDAVACLDVNR